MRHVLQIQNLSISFDGASNFVDNFNLKINKNECLGLIGESGSGKSTIAFAMMGYKAPNTTTSGSVIYDKKDLFKITNEILKKIRSENFAYIPQNPEKYFCPVFKIGSQLNDIIKANSNFSKKEIKNIIINILKKLGIEEPEICLNKYPHELSGGMQQRILIAIGLLKKPKVIIADEPTTALDSINQANVINLLLDLRSKCNNTSLILISHDLKLIKKACQRIIVLYSGMVVEEGSVEEISKFAKHPYTQKLLDSSNLVVLNENYHSSNCEINIQIKKGCPFWYKCENCMKICVEKSPILKKVSDNHTVACWRYNQ